MTYRLFECVGIELEYMLVDAAAGRVLPAADRLLQRLAKTRDFPSDLEAGPVSWSNELVNHVVELKVTEPVPDLMGGGGIFASALADARADLDALGATLMPTAMHPLMDPVRETVLWPHESREIYEAYDRIFDCRRHGWANVQSVHLNLPFGSEKEFAVLHAAIRALLPLMPGLAASSPIQNGRITGIRDNRMIAYAGNMLKIPHATARVIPEPVATEAEYRRDILEPLYHAIRPHDPAGILQHEFLNARGAIARFDRGAIEIRVLDIQEAPAMDVAIAEAVVHALRRIVDLHWFDGGARLNNLPTELLRAHLDRVVAAADNAVLDDPDYLRLLGVGGPPTQPAVEVWQRLTDHLEPRDAGTAHGLDLLFRHGALATRITDALPADPSPDALLALYQRLSGCLFANQPFHDA